MAALPTTIRRPEPVIPGKLHLCRAYVRLAGRWYSVYSFDACQVTFPLGCLSFNFTGLSGGGEFGVSLGLDHFGAALKFVEGRDIAEGAVQTLVIVMVHKSSDDLAGVLQRQGRLRADTGVFNGFVIAFQFAVALGIIG